MRLVTGATGLLGSRLAYDLLQTGEKVRALKRSGTPKDKARAYLRFCDENPDAVISQIEWVDGDLLDPVSLSEAMKGVECVYHCAAEVSLAGKNKDRQMLVNKEGTANLVNAALEAGAKEFCYTGSTAALGLQVSEEAINENMHVNLSAKGQNYGLSKFLGSLEVQRGGAEGLKTATVHPGVILSPGPWDDSWAQIFSRIYKGLKYYPVGMTGYVDVRDVSAIMIKAMQSGELNQSYLAVEGNYLHRDVMAMIAEKLGKKPPHIKMTRKALTRLAWLNQVLSMPLGLSPKITPALARTMTNTNRYDNQKVRHQLGHTFIPFGKSISFIAQAFLNDMNCPS